jgi:2-methylcitrate dehydratase PrpD
MIVNRGVEVPMVLETLAAYAANLGGAVLPDEVVHATKRCLIDWVAATVPGGSMPPATRLCEALADDLDRGGARLIPGGGRATLRAAALINGTAAHTAEVDDIYRNALYHPGAPVIAAALAAAQDRGASGDRLVRGIVSGYEVSTRIGATVNPAHYNFWHTTGTVGAFGAAAAVATVLGLDRIRTAHALANAGTLTAGLQQAFRADAMSKPLHAGRAAECGAFVALAAERGVTGALDILDGPRGFGAAMSDSPDWSHIGDDLGRTFNITQMTVKNYSACGHTHAAIDAIRELRTTHRLSPSDIARIRIATYAKALEVAGAPAPRTAFEAQFSLSYCVAVALVTGSARLDAFTPARLEDPVVRDVMTRIAIAVDPAAEAVYPKQRAAVVEVDTVDGRQLICRRPTRKGDPDNPLSDAELFDKFEELVAPALGKAESDTLLDWLLHVDTVSDVATLPIGSASAVKA